MFQSFKQIDFSQTVGQIFILHKHIHTFVGNAFFSEAIFGTAGTWTTWVLRVWLICSLNVEAPVIYCSNLFNVVHEESCISEQWVQRSGTTSCQSCKCFYIQAGDAETISSRNCLTRMSQIWFRYLDSREHSGTETRNDSFL